MQSIRSRDRPRNVLHSPWPPVHPNARPRAAKRPSPPRSSRPLPRRRRRTTRAMSRRRRMRPWRRWCCVLASLTDIPICWPIPVAWPPHPNGSCVPPRAFLTWTCDRRPVRRTYSRSAALWPEAARSAWRPRCPRSRSAICRRTTRIRPPSRSTECPRVSTPSKQRMRRGPPKMITQCPAISVDPQCYSPRVQRCCRVPVRWPPCRHRWPRHPPRRDPPRTRFDDRRRRRASVSRGCVEICRLYSSIPYPSSAIATRASRWTRSTQQYRKCIYLLTSWYTL